jgi:hypothetical protein
MIRGIVSSTGLLLNGQGFTSARTTNGSYTVTFTTAFSDLPAVTATVQSGLSKLVTVTLVTTGSVQIRTFDSATETLNDLQFNFIAIGPR